jgi:hypothetical protein
MASYRMFVLDANDHFVCVHHVFCANDSEAMTAARAVAAARGLLGSRCAVEVWGEGRMVGREGAADRSLEPVIPENGQAPRVRKRRRAAEIKAALKASQAMLDTEMQALTTWSRDTAVSDSTQPGSPYSGRDTEEEHPNAVSLHCSSP